MNAYNLQNCPTHGYNQNAWGCPECVRELRVFALEVKATAPAALETMKKHGYVIADLSDPIQKLAFTLYTELVVLAEKAEKVMGILKEDEGV